MYSIDLQFLEEMQDLYNIKKWLLWKTPKNMNNEEK